MKMTTASSMYTLIASFMIAASAQDPLLICYYTNWAQNRPWVARLLPADIDPDLCTHLIFAFSVLDSSYEMTTTEWNDYARYAEFNALKEKKQNLKTLLAVGGGLAGSLNFSVMAASSSLRANFVSTSVKYIRQHGFDGLDLDWEYPTQRGGVPADKENFATLLQELRVAFDDVKPRLLLSAAVPGIPESVIDASYDVKEMNRTLDFINLMEYDFHGAWENFTGFNSPLYARADESGLQATLNMNSLANYWVSKGASREKLIIGMPTYAQTYNLTDETRYSPGSPSFGPGIAGALTNSSGVLAYYEVCFQLDSGTGTRYFDPESRCPYYVNGNQWVGYDDVHSLTEKSLWLKANGFGGAMVWSLSFDDCHKACSLSITKFPLIKAIRETLQSNTVTSSTTSTTITQITSPTTTTSKTTITTTTITQKPPVSRHTCKECKMPLYVKQVRRKLWSKKSSVLKKGKGRKKKTRATINGP